MLGIAAGSATATTELACALAEPLELAARAVPQAYVAVHVDDSAAVIVATPADAVRLVVHYARKLIRELARARESSSLPANPGSQAGLGALFSKPPSGYATRECDPHQ